MKGRCFHLTVTRWLHFLENSEVVWRQRGGRILRANLPYRRSLTSPWHPRSHCDTGTTLRVRRPAEPNLSLPRQETVFGYQTSNVIHKLGNVHRKQKNQARWQSFLIVIFQTGTGNEKNLSNSWQKTLGVQKVIYTFPSELSTPPSYLLPFC